MLRLSFEGIYCGAGAFSVLCGCRAHCELSCLEKKQMIFKSGRRRHGACMVVGGFKLSQDSLKSHRSGVKLHSITPHLAWPQGVFG
jgi:hypothetical protein